MAIEVPDGVLPIASREAVEQAIIDGIALGERAGGVLTVIWGRTRTGFDGEAVTTGLAVEWKSGPRAPDQTEENVTAPGTRPVEAYPTGEPAEVQELHPADEPELEPEMAGVGVPAEQQ
jgi:hypothetical protein